MTTQNSQYEYDALLIHNSQDKRDVRLLKNRLEEQNLRVFLDERDLRNVGDANIAIDKAFRTTKKIVICLGPNGVGHYQNMEISAAVGFSEITTVVYLPGCTPGRAKKDLLVQLSSIPPIQFSNIDQDREPLAQLIEEITGYPPDLDSPTPASTSVAGVSSDQAAEDLVKSLRFRKIVFFVGAHHCNRSEAFPPCPFNLIEHFLEKLDLVSQNSVPEVVPTVDLASQLLLLSDGADVLEDDYAETLTKHSRQILPRYIRLASLVSKLTEIQPRRIVEPPPQLVITTRIDLMLEWSLLHESRNFSRITVNRQGTSLSVQEIERVKMISNGIIQITAGQKDQVINLDKFSEIEQLFQQIPANKFGHSGMMDSRPLTDLDLKKLPEPILIKYSGSQDIIGSSSITVEQYLKLGKMSEVLPGQVLLCVAQASSVFLDYSALDIDFLSLVYNILKESFPLNSEIMERYLIRARPDAERDALSRMESTVWDSIVKRSRHHGLNIVTDKPADFIESLNKLVQQLP